MYAVPRYLVAGDHPPLGLFEIKLRQPDPAVECLRVSPCKTKTEQNMKNRVGALPREVLSFPLHHIRASNSYCRNQERWSPALFLLEPRTVIGACCGQFHFESTYLVPGTVLGSSRH